MTSTVDATTAGTPAVPAVLDLSGHGPRDRLGRLVHADDPAAQLALALANLEDALTAAGLVPAELVEVTVRTTDVEAVLAVLDTLTERFREVEAGPRTTVVGSGRAARSRASSSPSTGGPSTHHHDHQGRGTRLAPTRKRRTAP